jgi:SAM-dependent methyltransferase
MTPLRQPGPGPTHHEELAGRFAERLLALRPSSVLDVGCGAGYVLGRCRDAGIVAFGLEARAERLPEGAGELSLLLGDATRLPLCDGSVDWVTLRHVPHHLEDPRSALAEAWRVARCGVLVAEPWFDPHEPSQVCALDADRWLKRQDRARGKHHAENHTAAELLAMLPERPARATIEAYTALRAHSLEELEALAARSVGERALDGDDAREWERHRERAASGRLTDNGTLIVCAWKPSGGRSALAGYGAASSTSSSAKLSRRG